MKLNWAVLFELAVYFTLTLMHSEQPKLYGVLAVLSGIGLCCMVSLQVRPPLSQRGTTYMTPSLLS